MAKQISSPSFKLGNVAPIKGQKLVPKPPVLPLNKSGNFIVPNKHYVLTGASVGASNITAGGAHNSHHLGIKLKFYAYMCGQYPQPANTLQFLLSCNVPPTASLLAVLHNYASGIMYAGHGSRYTMHRTVVNGVVVAGCNNHSIVAIPAGIAGGVPTTSPVTKMALKQKYAKCCGVVPATAGALKKAIAKFNKLDKKAGAV